MKRQITEKAIVAAAEVSDVCLRFRICRRRVERASGGCRGLCGPCYRAVKKLIDDEVFKEDELVKRNRILPRRQSVKEWCSEVA